MEQQRDSSRQRRIKEMPLDYEKAHKIVCDQRDALAVQNARMQVDIIYLQRQLDEVQKALNPAPPEPR